MWYVVCAILGAAVGGALAWLVAVNRTRSQSAITIDETGRRANAAEGQAAALNAIVIELRGQVERTDTSAEQLRIQLDGERGARVKA